MKNLFDPIKFGGDVAKYIADRGMTIRETAKSLGISHSALHRITQGSPPSVETYLRLRKWMKIKCPN